MGSSVWDFGNEGVVFDERVVGEWHGVTETDSNERQRDPVVQFVDNAGVAEDDLVHDDVVSVLTWHTSKDLWVVVFLEEEERN